MLLSRLVKQAWCLRSRDSSRGQGGDNERQSECAEFSNNLKSMRWPGPAGLEGSMKERGGREGERGGRER